MTHWCVAVALDPLTPGLSLLVRAQGVPWAGDPSKLDEMLSAATAELGTDAVTPLTDDQCKELCKIQPNFL